jgi:hypothetical protein
MKKTVRVVSLIVVIALALLVLTGCSDTPTVSGTKADVQAQMAVANSLTANQPTPTDISYSLERYNLIRRAYWVNGQRANKTAASYNEYVLKNSFVWNGNVPADIRTSLPYLD